MTHPKVFALVLAAHIIILVQGPRYAAPVWLGSLKDELNMEMSQMDVAGWSLYAGSLFLGIPGATILAERAGRGVALRICYTALAFAYLTLAVTMDKGFIGWGLIHVYAACGAIGFATGCAFACLFPMLVTAVGKEHHSLVSGSVNFLFSVGAVGGCVAYNSVEATALYMYACFVGSLFIIPLTEFVILLDKDVTNSTVDNPNAPSDGDNRQRLMAPTARHGTGYGATARARPDRDVEAGSARAYEAGPSTSEPPTLKPWSEFIRTTLHKPMTYIVMAALFLMFGIGATIINNMSNIALSIGDTKHNAGVTVLATIIAQLVGRLGMALVNGAASVVSEWLYPRTNPKKDPAPNVGLFAGAILSMVYAFLSYWGVHFQNNDGAATITAFASIFGAAYGCMWVLVSQLVPFVDKNGAHIARVLALVVQAGALGGLLGHLASAAMYEANITATPNSTAVGGQPTTTGGESSVCVGADCFRSSFTLWMWGSLVMAAVFVTGIFVHHRKTGNWAHVPQV